MEKSRLTGFFKNLLNIGDDRQQKIQERHNQQQQNPRTDSSYSSQSTNISTQSNHLPSPRVGGGIPSQIETSAQLRSKDQQSKASAALSNLFSSKQQKPAQSDLDRLKENWKKFRGELDKLLMDPTRYENNPKKCIEEKLKPKLQNVLDAILNEDLQNRETKTIGDCLEYILKESILQELVAYGKNDIPQGLFVVCLKFISFVILDIQATHIINHQEVHPAIMQLMMHIHNSIKNNMIDLTYDNSELKRFIIEFIKSLTSKIYEQPSLVSLLFTDSRRGKKKGAYLPMSILLLLLIKEDVNEQESLKLSLREAILMHLKLSNKDVLRYIMEESEICVILIAKLNQFFQSLPYEVELISNNQVTSQYPEDEDSKYLAQLNLHEQINQVFSNDKKEQHLEFREFVKYLAFLNKCALCIMHTGRLLDHLCTEFFNSFLLENLQPKLLKTDKPRIVRTTIQYLIQVLSMFTCSKLIKIVHHYIFGLPANLMIEEQEEIGRSSILSISNYDSLIDQNQISLRNQDGFNRQSTVGSTKSSHNRTGSNNAFDYKQNNSARGQRSIVSDLNLKISRINFENKQMKSSYAINNPFMQPLASPLHQKAARMNEIIDQVMESSIYEDNFDSYTSNQETIEVGPTYNIQQHKCKQLLQTMFKCLQRKDEKLGFVVLKFLDLLLEKNIPEINDMLFMQSIQKYVSTSVQGHNNQQSIQISSITKLQDKFAKMFPTAGNFIFNCNKNNNFAELSNILQSQMHRVEDAISLQINEQNMMLTDDGMESMDIFSFLLMSDHTMTLAEFDKQILQSPRQGMYEAATYKIQEETTDYTLPTEDDEDFQLEPVHPNNKYSATKKLNFDDSYSNASPNLKRQSFSANTEIDEVDRIDPLTFSTKGDFIRQISSKLQTFLANSPEENLVLTVRFVIISFLQSIINRIFSYPARLDEEYNMVDQMHNKATLLHIFLFEIPSQFSSLHYANPCQFLSILRLINEKVEELLQDKRMLLLVNAVKKEPDFLSYQLTEKANQLVLQNDQLVELFNKNRKNIYSIVILEEFLKEIAGCLFVKELAVDMLESYELAHLEDIKLECALAKFKKEINREEKQIEDDAKQMMQHPMMYD
eukprot:403366373